MRFADPRPPYCSCCFNQKNMEHIDFECYFDGPVIDQASGIKQMIDDLILCKECVETAARLLGMVYSAKAVKELAALRAENAALKAEAAEGHTLRKAVTASLA